MATSEARDLVDPYGRVVRDLRISVTDRCNFRCTYCMPEEGMEWLPRDEILSFEEIERLARICVERFGFDGIRLTGGEPTIRAHVTRLVEKLAALEVDGEPIDLAMTTNAATLRNIAAGLRSAGLRRLNISLDTLDREKFVKMTRRDELDNVLAGIAAAKEAGFDPVKINAVIERGTNDDELIDLARFGRDEGVEMRFIEFMPLDASDEWQRAKVVGQDEIVAAINEVWPVDVVRAHVADQFGQVAANEHVVDLQDGQRDNGSFHEIRAQHHKGPGGQPLDNGSIADMDRQCSDAFATVRGLVNHGELKVLVGACVRAA